MAASTRTHMTRTGRALLPPTLTLAWQRVRKTWGLLVLTELGMLGAVLLACVVPLYADVTMTAALRGILNASAQNSDIVVRTLPQLVSPSLLNSTTRTLNQELNRTLGPYLAPAQFSIESQTMPLLAPDQRGILKPARMDMSMISAEVSSAASHLTLITGRLPRSSAKSLEIAVTPATAEMLHSNVGDTLHTQLNFTDIYNTIYPQILDLHLVGLFTPAGGSDAFWHGDDFAPYAYTATPHLYALVPNATLLNTLARLSAVAASHYRTFVSTPDIIWYYHLDSARISIDDLNTLLTGIQQVQVDNANNPHLTQDPYLEQTQTYLPSPEALTGLSERISVILFPVVSLAIMILGLIFFFIGMMVNLLVERQGEAIALLRSRGASRRQVLGALLLQGLLLAALALLAGLTLAFWLVRLLTWQMFAGNDQGALNSIPDLTSVISKVGEYALLSVVVALLTIIFTVWGATRRDILTLRRESARSTRQPLAQRLRLDLVAVIIALVGYGFSVYLLHSNALDSQLYLLLLSPLALLQTFFLLLAGLLLIFRFYPQILRLGTRLAARRRSAAPVLALAQIARAPRQPVRMTLLLALASAFAIFSLIFTASQTQRVVDVASYQAGADFSGNIPVPVYAARDLSRMTNLYNAVPGVLGSSLGLSKQGQAGAALNLAVNFQAVDAGTFAGAATWSAQDTSQPLAGLMQNLLLRRDDAIHQNIVPAIVDINALNTLHLTQGATFTLQFPEVATDRPVTLKVVAEVQHIPTPGDSAFPGILADYATFASVYTGHFKVLDSLTVALNYAWLHTRADTRSLTSVRRVLSAGEMRLTPLYDTRAIAATLFADPIYLTLIGELELGAFTALFLALLGCLVASWLSAHSRLTNFVALRALGATPRQVVSTLAWEQGIVYTAALLLGILTGSLLAALSLPSLVLTSVLPSQETTHISSANFYAAQFVPPLQVVLPVSLWLALGVLVVICLFTLGLMVYKVARSSISLVLRLSED